MSPSRSTLLLAPAGLFGGHALLRVLGPWFEVEPHALGSAGVSPWIAAFALAVSFAALAAVWRVSNQRQRVGPLMRSQLVLFVLFELAERHSLLSVVDEAMHDPRWWIVVACQVLATAAVLVVVQVGEYARMRLTFTWSLVVWFLPATPKRLVRRSTPWLRWADGRYRGVVDRRRGPPVVVLQTA